MTRCIVILNHADSFINIEADRIEDRENFFIAMQGDAVAGVFDKGCVIGMYLTEKTAGGRRTQSDI